jgi:hypothetical protein
MTYLLAGAGGSKKGAGDAASNGGSNTRVTEAGSTEGLDSLNGDLLLAETGLGHGEQEGESGSLGHRHDC